MIRLGIVGSNYGRNVQLPAFRADPRCEVVALAGSDEARTAERARDGQRAERLWRLARAGRRQGRRGGGDCHLPGLAGRRSRIAALALGKPVFAEKPMASTLDRRARHAAAAETSRLATMIDFNFHQIVSWQRAKAMLDAGAIGRLRHVARALARREPRDPDAHAQLENLGDDGGGVLGNFI